MKTKYTKMHSNGNEFLITEDIKQTANTKKLADKKNGIGFDQLLCIKNKKPYGYGNSNIKFLKLINSKNFWKIDKQKIFSNV